MNRQEFIRTVTGSVVLSSMLPAFSFCNSDNQSGLVSGNSRINLDFMPDIDVELTAAQRELQVLTGNKTGIYTYDLNVQKADRAVVETLPDSWLGPVFRVRQGQKIRIRFKNRLPQESVIHWHGLHLPPEMDGHPMYAIGNGQEFILP